MTEQTVTSAVAKRDNEPASLITRYKQDFTTVLPSHIKPETWLRLAQGALRRNKELAKVAARNPGSFLAALLECARLGHEPATEAFYLVPFGNEVQGIEGYRGIVERIYRAGAVSSVKAEVVYSKDKFNYQPGMERPEHEVDWFADDRGELRGAYAYAIMLDGSTSRVVVLNKQYIERVKKESRGSNSPSSPWQKWPESMWLKTAARRLEAWVPTSSEYIRERLRAVRDVENETRPVAPTFEPLPPAGVVDIETGEVFDAEIVDDHAAGGES